MISGILDGLLAALILSIFNVNEMFIEVLQPFIENITITDSHYYIAFAIVGLVGGMFSSGIN